MGPGFCSELVLLRADVVTTLLAFTVLVALVGLERVAELVVSTRNAAWSRERGGVESGLGHFPFMVVLHTALLVGALVEAWVRRPDVPSLLAWSMLALVVASQALRWWCIATLGRRWNTRVIVVPGPGAGRLGPLPLPPPPQLRRRRGRGRSRCRSCTPPGSPPSSSRSSTPPCSPSASGPRTPRSPRCRRASEPRRPPMHDLVVAGGGPVGPRGGPARAPRRAVRRRPRAAHRRRSTRRAARA